MALADWLAHCGIETVVLESTGIYWIPLFELLESRGLEVLLVDPRRLRHVPGRKTDVLDCQWLQQLHTFGLLSGAFRPANEVVVLRSYLRQRAMLVQYASQHIQHMQKALTFMNLQLHHVVSDVTGVTGLKIVRAVIAGERDAKVLASMRDIRCKATPEVLEGALQGNYRPEHIFALRQALELHDFYQREVEQCDRQIQLLLDSLAAQAPATSQELPKPRHRTKQPNAVDFDTRPLLHRIAGTDLTQIHGIGPYLALRLISECGTDLSRWPSAKHFTSWLSLSPGCKISGGKVLSSRTRRSNNPVAVHLRLAAVTVGRTDTALGAFYRRLAARIGKAKAVTATKHSTLRFHCCLQLLCITICRRICSTHWRTQTATFSTSPSITWFRVRSRWPSARRISASASVCSTHSNAPRSQRSFPTCTPRGSSRGPSRALSMLLLCGPMWPNPSLHPTCVCHTAEA